MPLRAWTERLYRTLCARRPVAARRALRRRAPDNDFIRLGLTRLEDRVVLDGAAVVADLNPGTDGSAPAEQVEFNGSVYFSADGTDGSGQSVGRELYRLDPDGSVSLVADINDGEAGSDPSDFRILDGELYFAATGSLGRELYKLDADGNVTLVADVNPGEASSNPQFMSDFNNKLYFAATGSEGRELYVVNRGGNASLVSDINPGSADSNPSDFVEFGGNLYFVATGPDGRVLYQESPSGTSDPQPINLGAGVTDPQGFTEYEGALYFSALDPADGRELFKLTVDRRVTTVTKVANLDGTSASSSPAGFKVFDGHLYFAATTANGRELFQLDSTGNIVPIDIAPGAASSSPAGFTEFDGQLYFAATVDGERGLYRLDTSGAAPSAVAVPLPAGVTLLDEAVFYALDDELYFAADGPQGRELYVLNLAGVVELAADINAGPGGSDPADLRLFAGRIYVVATEPAVGRELFVLLRDPSSLRVVDGTLVFTDESGDEDNRLVISSDGTNLTIRDENGHDIALLTPLAGAAGSGTSAVTIPLSSLAGVSSLAINTRGGNDSVTFDLSSNADALLGQFVTSTYDGGDNAPDRPGDRLRFIGDGDTNSIYTPDATATGSGMVIVSSSTQTTTFEFDNLEPVEFTAMASATLVTPNTISGGDVLIVSEGVDSLDGLADVLIVSGTVGGTPIESAYFFGNDSVVILTGSGVDGTDQVTVLGADNAHDNANLTIDTGSAGEDSVFISGDVTLAGELTIHTFLLDVQAILTLGGNGWLTARDDIVFSAAGGLLVQPAASIDVTLVADADGTGGGGIALADGAVIDAGAGTIALTATDDITLGRLVTTNSGPAAVTITSLAGAVLDNDDAIDIVAGSLVLTAQSAGTQAAPLQTQIGSLTATLQAGDLHLVEADGLTIQSVAALAPGGDVSITSLTGNLLVRHIAAAGLVSLNAPQGAILKTGAEPVTITAADLELAAANGAGASAAPLLTDVDRLEAAGGTGGIFIQNSGDLQIGGIIPSLLTLSGLSATNSDIVLSASGSLNTVEAVQTSGAGAINLAAAQDLTIGAAVGATDGSIEFTAGRSLALIPGASVSTDSGAITLLANQGAIATPGSFSGITLDSATISSQNGPISLTAKSGNSGANLTGIELRGGSTITSVDGSITVTGVSLGTSAGSDGVRVLDGGQIATSGAGSVTVTGTAGASGHGILILNGSGIGATSTGNVLLAGAGGGGLADIAWDSLTIEKTGGTYTFQDTVEGGQLFVLPGNYQVVFLDGGVISGAVDFQNSGGVVLGDQDSDLITFAGGLISIAGPTTIQGTVATESTCIQLGPTTLVSTVTLQTAGGNVTIGPISGAGVPLTILAGSGDVSLANPANVIGDLVINADQLTLVENDDITQAGAWTTTGLTTLNAGSHDIVLNQPGNVLGDLVITANQLTLTENADITQSGAWTTSGLTTLDAGSHDIVLDQPGNVLGDLIITANQLTLIENDDITQGAAWTTIGLTILNAGTHDIVLAQPGNVLGDLVITADELTLTESDDITQGEAWTTTGLTTLNAGIYDIVLAQPENVLGDLIITSNQLTLIENDDITQGGAWTTTGLTILNAGTHDILLGQSGNVLGDLIITSDQLTLTENDDITQGGAWTTTGLTILNVGTHDIVLALPGNVLGDLIITADLLTLTENDDITQGGAWTTTGLTILNAGTHDIFLAQPGNVLGALIISADHLTLTENDDITQGGAWTTTGLTILNAGAHDIVLAQPGNVLGPLQLTGANVTVVEAGDMELSAASFSGNLNASTTGNLLVSGFLSGSGAAHLAASGDIAFTPTGSVQAQPAASIDVTLLADADSAGGGAITLADGALIDAGAGTIALTATDDITLGRLLTTNSSPTAIAISSLVGAVLDGGDSGGADITAESPGAVVTIEAFDGAGTPANPLDLQVRRLVVKTTDGDQHLSELDDLESIDLNAGQAQIVLTAGGAVQDDDATTDVVAGSLVLTAQSAGTQTAPLQTQIGSLTATLQAGDFHLVEADGLTIQNVAALAAGGDVAITSVAGNLLIQRLAAGGLVSLNASQGAIQKTGTEPLTITAADLELAAAAGVGTSAAPLLTNVDRLEAAGGTGGVYIQNSGDLQIGGIGSSLLNLTGLSANSNVAVNASGSLSTVEAVQTTGAGAISLGAVGDVSLDAPVSSAGGDINLAATRNVFASAAGDITTGSGTIRLTADNDNAAGGTIQFAGDIDVGSGTAVFSLPDSTGLMTGIISGSGGVVKQGPGTLTFGLTSINTYTGTTDVLAGTFRVDGAIGAGAPAQRVTIAGGATLTGSGDVNAPIFASATTARIISAGNLRLGDGSSAGFDFAGTLIVDGTDFQDGPDIVVVRDSDLAQLGLLTMIEAGGRLVADNGVEVSSGERLAGSGAVDGNVVVLSGGQVSPGASPGALGTDAGDVTLQPGAIYTSEVNGLAPGTQYDQVNVEGDVTVDGAVLQLEGGRFQPPKGTVFTLISNDGADPVQGTFRDSQGRALTEGATVKFGGTTAKISYVGGPGGNDVTLTVVDSVFVRNQTTDVTLVGGAVLPRDSERQLAPRQTPRTVLASDSTQSARQSQGFDSRTAALEVRTAQRLRVFFRLVNEGSGQEEPKEYELDPGVLRDLLATFKRFRFQDGRYRIYLQEPGKRERLILDVNVMEGKVVPPNFREAEISPGASAPQEHGADASEADAFDQPPDANPAPAEKTRVGNELEPAAAASSGSPGGAGSQASLTLAVGAAAAVAAMPDWQARVRALLASGEIPRTKFSRLLRRIRPR